MKVILLNDISKLGHRYDIKDVSSGHALNFLIPKSLAIAATPEALKRVEKMKAAVKGEKKVQEELMSQNVKALEGIVLNLKEKANAKGHLFAGLHKDAIAKELGKQHRLEIDPSAFDLPEPIKTTGEHSIPVKFESASSLLKVVISAK